MSGNFYSDNTGYNAKQLNIQSGTMGRIYVDDILINDDNSPGTSLKGKIDSIQADTVNLVTNRTNVNIQEFVIQSDNGDYALAFNRAISFLKTNGLSVLELPSKTLNFKSDTTPIDFGLQLIGRGSGINGNRTQIVDARTSATTPLLTYKASAIGFRISDILFYGNYKKHDCLLLEQNCGWDYHIERCTFHQFRGSAIRTAASDGYISNCLFTSCGTTDNEDAVISYAIQFEKGANMQHFVKCHIEHCRFAVNITTGFMNSFLGCKFEQSGRGLSHPSTLSPIEINTTGAHTKELSFDNCVFIPASDKAYIDAKTLGSIDDVPYFININSSGLDSENQTNTVMFNGCTSRTGLGSSSYVIPDGCISLLKSRAKTIICGGTFNKLTGSRYAVDMKVGSIVGVNFNFMFCDPDAGYETKLPNNGYGIMLSNYCVVTGCYFNGIKSGTIVDTTKSYAVNYNQLDYPLSLGVTAANNTSNMVLYDPNLKVDLKLQTLTLLNGCTGHVKYGFEMGRMIVQIAVTINSNLGEGSSIASLPRFLLQDYAYIDVRNTTRNTDTRLRIEGKTLKLTEPLVAGDVIKGSGIIV